MKKILKKVLFITDNYDDWNWKWFKKDFSNGNYYYNEESNWIKFKCDILKKLEQAKNIKKGVYDIILIDYGIIGDIRYNTAEELNKRIKIIEDLYKKCEYLILQGIMAKYYIENDIKNYMNKFKILKKLKIVSFGRDDLLYDLYHIIRK